MPIAAACTCDSPRARGQITWLFEDVWIDPNGDAELQIEAIVRQPPGSAVSILHLFLPYEITSVLDQTADCVKHEFLHGYPECWPAVYTQYEIADVSQRNAVMINRLRASVRDITARIVSSGVNCSEVEVCFDPPVESEGRIFRIACMVRGFSRSLNQLLPKARKQFVLHTYGLAPFGGGAIPSLMQERGLDRRHVYPVRLHHMQVAFVEVNRHSVCSRSPQQEFQLSDCRNPDRFCPPVERQSSRTGVPTRDLRESPNSSMHWKDENVGHRDGGQIRVTYCESTVQQWIEIHWLGLVSLMLALTSLTVALIRFFR